MKTLSAGKFMGLQRIATRAGGISVLALDHRNNLRTAINPQHPDRVTDAELSAFKVAVTRALSPAASAILLDPEVGALQAISAQAIDKTCGLVVALEKTGYTGDPHARESKLLPGWSVRKAKLIGADAVKLLVYYHPKSPNAGQIEALIASVAEQCRHWEMLFMLEALTYSIDPREKKLSGGARRETIIESAQRLASVGGDILKVEFPLDINDQPGETDWAEACRELTEVIDVPWILLSASVDFETYLRQVEIACRAGAAGIAAGRAVWKEAVTLDAIRRERFLEQTARERMERLTSAVDASARPHTGFYRMV